MLTAAPRAAPGFGVTASSTVPPPFPVSPDVIAIQFTGLVAVQLQPPIVPTSMDRRPPPAPSASEVRLNVKTHGAGACVNDTLCEPTTIAPVRVEGTGLGATVYGTDASPCPPRSPAIDTQLASVPIDQVQSRAVVIVSDPSPPVGPNDEGALLTLTWHFSDVGAVNDVLVLLHAAPRQAPAAASPTTNM
jgi:hypothetical protein